MEEAILNIMSKVLTDYGPAFALIVVLFLLVFYMLVKCRADSLQRDELHRADIKDVVTALSELRKVQSRSVEMLIAIKEATHGR